MNSTPTCNTINSQEILFYFYSSSPPLPTHSQIKLKLNSDYLKKFKQAFHLPQKIHLGIDYQVLLVLWAYHPQEVVKSDQSHQRCP